MKSAFGMETLVAAIWASAALATPLTAELLDRRDDVLCPKTYTTENGLNFTSYCDKNNPGNDALEPFLVDTMEECMERCSRYWGQGEGCFGVVWREDKNCWLRNSTTSAAGMVNDTNIHSALVVQGDMKGYSTDCPETDLSTHTLSSNPGIGYTVHCGKVISNYDIAFPNCWSGYPSCLESPYSAFYHTTTLDECLEICVKEHPLCRGVSYNPGLEIGFANCWPKTGFGNTLQTPDSDMGVLHSATITSLDRIDNSCPTDKTYTSSSDNKAFEIHCGQVNAGTNITSVHMANLISCIDTCAASSQGCIGIVFDSSLGFGYDNCYLQNTTSVISDQASGTYALLSGTSIPTSSSTSSPNNSTTSNKSSSKAWVAGPVIGGIIGIALIVGALLFFRRRKAKAGVAEKGVGGYDDQNPYDHHQQAPPVYGGGGYAQPPMQHQESYGAHSELGGSNVTELAAPDHGSAKYAHKQVTQEPQELA